MNKLKSKLSFITAARTEEEVLPLQENLDVVFHSGQPIQKELIVSAGYNSIYSAYDNGAAEAKGDVLAFIHTDVTLLCNYTTFNPILDLVQKPFTGACGVAGATYLPEDGVWWRTPVESTRGAVYHSNPNSPFAMHLNSWPWATPAALFGEVVILDGVLLIMSRKTFDALGGFVATGGSGWHHYDARACVKLYNKGYSHYAAPIPLFHKSPGRPDDTYEESRKAFVRDFRTSLPMDLRNR